MRERPAGDLVFLDGLRGLAAFYVMVGHARWLLWEGYSKGYLLHPERYSPLERALVYFFSAFRYGHEAVLFFFLLSGFVIHLRQARAAKELGAASRFDYPGYLKRRALRIYPPLLWAIAVTFLCDRIVAAAGWNHFFSLPAYLGDANLIQPSHEPSTLAGNLLLCMNTYGPVWGSNGPLWSLKYEWWFYMFYPAFLWVSKRSVWTAAFLVAALSALAQAVPGWPVRLLEDVFVLMVLWWAGVLLADVYAGRIASDFRTLSVLVLALPAAFILKSSGFLRELSFVLSFAGAVSVCFALQEKGFRLVLLEKLKPLGDMSYTLYVTHFPLLFLLSGWLVSRRGVLPEHFGWIFLGCAFSLLVSYGAHFLVERPFVSRRRRAEVLSP